MKSQISAAAETLLLLGRLGCTILENNVHRLVRYLKATPHTLKLLHSHDSFVSLNGPQE